MKRRHYVRRRRKRRKARTRFYVIIGVLAAALAVGIFLIVTSKGPGSADSPSEALEMTPPDEEAAILPTEETQAPATPTPEPSLAVALAPYATEDTQPTNFDFETDIMNDGLEVDSFLRDEAISFATGEEYTQLEGVITFRGNNYRDAASYGTADITQDSKLEVMPYNKETSSIGDWGGSGWTGQPLIVKWPAETRENMTMLFDEFKTKEDFIEVIYPTLDGRIYFMELSTGEKTRDFINIGAPTKGTASLDPRGYPIIYVGQGLSPEGSKTECNDMYYRAFSLIDGSLLMSFGSTSGDPFAHRNWQAYDSSALIDAETDTLIVLGENGVLYTCKLNTNYDAAEGTVTMDTEPVKQKYRYTTPRNLSADDGGRWGMENSAVAWREYLIFTDNIGMLQCVNLNTLELVYANDLTDDSDVSMVLEEDIPNNTFYLYTGCEYDELVRKNGNTGEAYARKLDGITGEVIWEIPYNVKSGSVDGGILASPVLGREGTSMEGLIIYNVTKETNEDGTTNRLVALDKLTGAQVWDYDMEVSEWSPSSPVPVYTADGKGYIIQCDYAGDVALLDGATGDIVDVLNVGDGNNFEATPAIYGNTIVVGSRSKQIFFIEIN